MSESKVCEGCGKQYRRPRSCRPSTFSRRRYCTRRCAYDARKGTRLGEAHPSWKGGRFMQDGYVRVRHEGRYVLEQRLVMERALGRPLRDDETVHHRNGVRDDNRPENLELRVGRHGRGAALCCADCGSVNLVPLTPS